MEADDKLGRTPLLLAAYNGSNRCIEYLILSGSNIHHKDINGRNFLELSIIHGKKLQCLENKSFSKVNFRNGYLVISTIQL